MSEGFHRGFAPSRPVPALVLVVVAEGDEGWAVWTEEFDADRRVVASGDDGAVCLPRVSLDGASPVAAALRWVEERMRAHDPSPGDTAWAAADFRVGGRWESPAWSRERFVAEILLAASSKQWPLGGQGSWLSLPHARADWEAGRLYPGPLGLDVLEVLWEVSPRHLDAVAARLREKSAGRLGGSASVMLAPGIRMVPLLTPTLPPAAHTQCVVFEGRRLVIVDPGSPYPEEQRRLEALLEDAIARGGHVDRIVLTHHHRDHVGGAAALREAFGAPVAAHPATAERVGAGVAVDEFLHEGDHIPWGNDRSLRVLHTPGHAPGHVCLVEEGTGIAAVGDMIAGDSTIVIDPPDGHMATYLAQLERLAALELALAVPSHGGVILQPAKRFRDTARHRVWREGVLLDALAPGQSATTRELLPRVYGDVDPRALPIAVRQLVAHLDKLAEEGRVLREGAGWRKA